MRLALIITARPSYAKVQTLVPALLARGVELQLVVCASALLERYGHVVEVIRQECPDVPITEVWSTYEGANLLTSAKETGALVSELSSVVQRCGATAGLVVADRHEVLGAAQAIAYQHIPLIHLQGGERTGSIDDKVRDAITQLADVHLVATERAKYRVYGLTGAWEAIHVTGCPSIDVAHQAVGTPAVTLAELGGAGSWVDLQAPFAVVLQHPVTSEAGDAGQQMAVTLEALEFRGLRPVVFWPGEDAGAEQMAKAIRRHPGLHTVRTLPPVRFLRLLTQAACLVGNSSAGIRECSALGVPVVNIGTRQYGRERGPNVVDVPAGDGLAITRAIYDQVTHGPYLSSALYGDGHAGERMAEVISGL